jgi:hypothetical protein
MVFTDWREREVCRFASGEYQTLPIIKGFLDYNIKFNPDHFIHRAKSDGALIAFTQSSEHGQQDRQTVMRLGRYLRRYGPPELTDVAIEQITTEYLLAVQEAAPLEIAFATDIPTINEIFETPLCASGGSHISCMQGKWDGDTERPYHVYANSPDVAVAYLRAPDGAIIARSVVNMIDSAYVRVYARRDRYDDAVRFKQLL